MSTRNASPPGSHLLSYALVGAGAGVLGGLAMNVFARIVRRINDGREADGAAPGHDRDGRGMQPPQAQGQADRDAAVAIGTLAYHAVSGREPGPAGRRRLGSAAHYGFSAAVGACYAVASDRAPALRSGFGILYGSLVWAVADEGMVPAMGLSRGPRELPLGVHIYSLCGHWLYGATLEGVTRIGVQAVQRR